MKNYPAIGSVEKSNAKQSPYFKDKVCDICGEKLGNEFIRIEVQYTYMRGDDEVFAVHKECQNKFNVKTIISKNRD